LHPPYVRLDARPGWRWRLGLLLGALALVLAACGGAPPADAWPGMAVDGSLAYVAYNTNVYLIDFESQKELQRFPEKPAAGGGLFSSGPAVPNQSAGHFFSAPGLGADVLVIAAARPATSHSGVIFGLDPATMDAQWCLAFDRRGAQPENDMSLTCALAPGGSSGSFLGYSPPADNRVIGGITLADGVAYFGLASGRVFAVDTEDGAVRWSFSSEHQIYSEPQVMDSTVYVTSFDHFLYALDREDGTVKWKVDLGAASAGSPAFAAGNVFAATTFGNQMFAFDAATGRATWTYATRDGVWGGPVAYNGNLYFTDLSGNVYALDAATGAETWVVTPGLALTPPPPENRRAMPSSPTVTEQALYVGDRAGNLYALNPATGSTIWNKNQPRGELLTSPVIVDSDTLLVSIYQGDNLLVVYDVTATSAVERWAYAPSR
jgi:outer membrane protein assembly factor BamB